MEIAECFEGLLGTIVAASHTRKNSTDGGAVMAVKKHWQQPMAYVEFASAELAQAALASPPALAGAVQLLPIKAHASDASKVVIRWLGHAAELSEMEIAECFEGLLGTIVAASHMRNNSTDGGAVMEVKKHWQKPMAYVTFRTAVMAKAVLANAPDSVGGVATLPCIPHQTECNSIVLKWDPHEHLSQETIAAQFDALVSGLPNAVLGMQPQQMPAPRAAPRAVAPSCPPGSNPIRPIRPVPTVSPVAASTTMVGMKRAASAVGLAPAPSAPKQQMTSLASTAESTGDDLTFDGKFVCDVRKHHTQTMAYVRFRTPELAAAVMASTPIDPPIRWPPHAHRSDQDTIVVKWESAMPITPFELAMWMEAWLQEICEPESGGAMAENRLDEDVQALFDEAFAASDQWVPMVKDSETRMFEKKGKFSVSSVYEQEEDATAEGLGAPADDAVSSAGGVEYFGEDVEKTLTAETNSLEEGVVAAVRRHHAMPMAFVTFRSEEHAQLVLANPPQTIAEAGVRPARPHNSEAATIVLRWNGGIGDLSDAAIAEHFNYNFFVVESETV